MTETLQQLLLIYAGVLVINLLLSGLLWRRYRTPLHRDLFMVWAATLVFFLFQGIPGRGVLWQSLCILPGFFVNYSLAVLLGRLSGIRVASRLYFGALVLGVVVALIAYYIGGPFWAVALGPSASLALPTLHTPWRVLRSTTARTTTIGRAFVFSTVALGLHDLDYPFLRDKPQFAVLGFTLALLSVLALAITAPATVLERVTEDRTRVQQQNELQRRFFSNITHELRTPLTIMLAPLEGMLAGEYGPLTETQRSYIEATRRNGVRLLKLINDILDLAKLEEGFVKLRPQKVDLRALLETLVADARPLAERKHLTIDLVADELPAGLDVHLDVEKIERVFVNLVSNALKFTEAGGVTVRARVVGDDVEISVDDSGIGIAPEHQSQIFERFQQGDGSVTRRFGGTGIGLAYAKEIVDLHGGSISVESQPQKGSRFTVRLKTGDSIPAAAREQGRGPADSTTGPSPAADGESDWVVNLQRRSSYRFAEVGFDGAASQSGKENLYASARILVVEDNPEILDFVASELRKTFTIYTAGDGEAGLERAHRERPDLIVTDFMMPKVDGLTMLRALREDKHLAKVPVIMLTSKNQLADRLAGREAGADVYLTKPFSPRELQAAVAQLLTKQGRHVQDVLRAHTEGLEIVSASLAHEVQNPLNFVKNAHLLIAENISKVRQAMGDLPVTDPVRAEALEKAKDKIDRMVESAGRGVKRIEDVVSLMRRYAREGYPTQPVEVDVDRAITDVVELVAPRGDVACRVALDLAAGGDAVFIVPEDLHQVIRSLVQNAVEAVGEGGQILVRTRNDPRFVTLEVIDNGPGIAPEELRRIFSPFFTTKAGNGRGLGLAIVQIVVSRAGGTIEATSVRNVETIFRVRLPNHFGIPAEAKKITEDPPEIRGAS